MSVPKWLLLTLSLVCIVCAIVLLTMWQTGTLPVWSGSRLSASLVAPAPVFPDPDPLAQYTVSRLWNTEQLTFEDLPASGEPAFTRVLNAVLTDDGRLLAVAYTNTDSEYETNPSNNVRVVVFQLKEGTFITYDCEPFFNLVQVLYAPRHVSSWHLTPSYVRLAFMYHKGNIGVMVTGTEENMDGGRLNQRTWYSYVWYEINGDPTRFYLDAYAKTSTEHLLTAQSYMRDMNKDWFMGSDRLYDFTVSDLPDETYGKTIPIIVFPSDNNMYTSESNMGGDIYSVSGPLALASNNGNIYMKAQISAEPKPFIWTNDPAFLLFNSSITQAEWYLPTVIVTLNTSGVLRAYALHRKFDNTKITFHTRLLEGVRTFVRRGDYIWLNKLDDPTNSITTISISVTEGFRRFSVQEVGFIKNGWLLSPYDQLAYGSDCLTYGWTKIHAVRNDTKKYGRHNI